MEDAQDEITGRFPWKQFPEYRGQQLVFFVRNFQVASDGRLSGFDVSTVYIRPTGQKITDSNHPLVKAFKETLKSIYPWEVFYINGNFMMEYPSMSIPIQEEKAAGGLPG